ncbi:ATP binding protein-like protein [Trypanosoma cruzi cruzi]|uniref:Putative ATP binding protein-like protein n=1 Tax=Trypanosoma cruzi TaxID=5693 RepID=A0A2V2UVR1_TRYCR|nr:putative ATP binding protein-like protein [Trypanosoma cruzi]PBJ76659.1 ATP binding protein-like protein [Trypanosoma cruzi cruzi]PWU88061.1 putative ATP binding protein-like protein [Trypanosoma cruzi]
MENLAENALLRIAENIERAVDDEMEHIDNLDDDELMELRRKRLKALKEMGERRDAWLRKGHGQLQEMADPKDFFNAVEQSERVVLHFMRRSTLRCSILERHLRAIASKHFETRFCYVDVERLPALAERFNVMMLPTLMLIENKKTFHSIIGFDEFGGTDDFSTHTVVKVLSHYGMVNERGMFSDDQSAE